jgi:translation initiation factor IF-3
MAHQELGAQLLDRVKDELGEKIRIEHMPKLEGRQMIMIVAPSKS